MSEPEVKPVRTRRERDPNPAPDGGRLSAGKQLSAVMARLNINQTILAEMCGTSQPEISLLENEVKIASPELALKIEEVTGLPASVWRDEAIIRAARGEAKAWHEHGV